MQLLEFPENLQPYYAEIYVALRDVVPEFVPPENFELLQRLIHKLSGLMDGYIDERGPAGLLVYMIRRLQEVPARDFSGERARRPATRGSAGRGQQSAGRRRAAIRPVDGARMISSDTGRPYK